MKEELQAKINDLIIENIKLKQQNKALLDELRRIKELGADCEY